MLKIRLKPMGRIGTRVYRIVVADEKEKRDGKVVDTIGFYDSKLKPDQIKFDRNKIDRWIKLGAVLSEPLRKLIKE